MSSSVLNHMFLAFICEDSPDYTRYYKELHADKFKLPGPIMDHNRKTGMNKVFTFRQNDGNGVEEMK